jgi:hypothetical protein
MAETPCRPKIDQGSGNGVRAFAGVLQRLRGAIIRLAMAKKNERDADRDSSWKWKLPWEWCVAILPFRFQFRIGTKNVGTGRTTYHRSGFAIKAGQPVPMTDDANETQRKDFYEALLKIDWLAAKVRHAVMRELGRSQRAANVARERGRTLAIRARINERKNLMKKKNERPRGGVYEAALAEVAKEQGVTVPALKGRLLKKRLHR